MPPRTSTVTVRAGLPRPRTAVCARASDANGPSLGSAFGAASVPDHASLPSVATKKSAVGEPGLHAAEPIASPPPAASPGGGEESG